MRVNTLDLQYTHVRDVYTVPTSPTLTLVVQQLQYSHLFLELQDDVLQLSLLLLTIPREGGQLGANTRQLLVSHRHQLFKVVLKGGVITSVNIEQTLLLL